MKILHISDLHLGKNLLEESLFEDQKYILDEIIDIIKDRNIKVVMIPGDIYDKSIPSSSATNLFDDFLTKLAKLNINILITSGNHDMNERLRFGSKIFDKFNIHIVTEYDGYIKKVVIDDINFYMLPFLKPFHIKNLMDEKEYENICNSNDMMKWILDRESIDKSKKNILMAHQFVMYNGLVPEGSESEAISINNVGTLDAIDVNLLDSFNYVALGHIHKPQKIKKDTIRYSGTPLKYSFSEVNDKKSVVIIDSDTFNIELVPLKPLREMRVLRGTFDEVMNMDASDDLIKVELEDENTIISPMDEIRKRYKNAISLVFINKLNDTYDKENISVTENSSPYELFKNFFIEQNNRDLNSDEDKYIKTIMDSLGDDK